MQSAAKEIGFVVRHNVCRKGIFSHIDGASALLSYARIRKRFTVNFSQGISNTFIIKRGVAAARALRNCITIGINIGNKISAVHRLKKIGLRERNGAAINNRQTVTKNRIATDTAAVLSTRTITLITT